MQKPFSKLIPVASFLFAATSLSALAQEPTGQPKVLLYHEASLQAASAPDKEINLTPYVKRNLEEHGKYAPIILKAGMPELERAVVNGAISAIEARGPFTPSIARRIAAAMSVEGLVRVSSWVAKDGIITEANVEARKGQSGWATIFAGRLDPQKSKNTKGGPLEAILAHAGLVTKYITGEETPKQQPTKSAVETSKTTAQSQKTKQDITLPPETKVTNVEPDPKVPVTKVGNTPTKNATKPGDLDPTAVKPPPITPNVALNRVPAPLPRETQRSITANEILIDRFRQSGDRANMIVTMRKAVSDRPRDPRLRSDLIQSYLDNGWNEAARDEATRAVALNPDVAMLRRRLGEALIKCGQPEKAIDELKAAVAADSKDAQNHVALGDAYMAAAKPEQAELAYAAATSSNAKSSVPFRRLAALQSRRGKLPEAVIAMKAASQLVTDEDFAEYVDDYTGLLRVAESNLLESLTAFQTTRKDLVNMARTREVLFKEVEQIKTRARNWTDFLIDLPSPTGYARVQALYAQGGSLVIQAAETLQRYIETASDPIDKEFTLMRLEAGRQLQDAADKLKVLSGAKTATGTS